MNDNRTNNLGFIFEESYENADSFLKDITYGGELYDYFLQVISFLEVINLFLINSFRLY